MHVVDPVRFRLGELEFTWNLGKGAANMRKHGITFEEAATTWLDPLAIERFDDEHSGDEDRWVRVGASLRGALLVTWSTERPMAETTRIRIIGARRANRAERRLYEEAAEERGE